MAIKILKTTFSAGEVSPQFQGRIELATYDKAADKIRNCYVDNIGYCSRREGLRYIATTPSSAEVRLVDFEFNNEQNYLLEFSLGQFRVFKDNVLVTTITASPVSGLTLDQIKAMDFVQSADTLILAHPDFLPIQITRTSDTVWLVGSVPLTNIPYHNYSTLLISTPGAELSYSQTSGRAKITLDAGSAAVEWVGQKIIFDKGGILRVTEFISATQFWGNWIIEPPDDSPVVFGDWELESGYELVWSVARGYPISLTFFQGRLWFGGSGSRPQTLWGSVVGEFFNFDGGTGLDDEAIDITPNFDTLSAIKFTVGGQTLQIFTSDREFYIPISVGKAITPSSIAIESSTSHGVGDAKPISIDGSTLFIEESGSVVRQFVYNELEQTYNATNVSIVAPTLITNVKKMIARGAVQGNPISIAYCVNEDGTVAVLNTLREQEFRAWSLFETDGTVEDIVELAGDVYVVVSRNIGGVDVRFIELFDSDYLTDAAQKDTDATPNDTWTGFDHLDGEECSAIGDGFVLTDVTPSSGAFTSNLEVEEIEAGLFFAAKVTTLPLEFANPTTVTQAFGDRKRLVYANLKLYESRNVVVQVGTQSFVPPFRTFGSDTFDQPVSNYTGWKKVFLRGAARDVQVTVTQTQPLEFNLLAIAIGVA